MLRKLKCDCCTKNYTDETESEEQHWELAREMGWGQMVVENGSVWDFCPLCYRKELDDRNVQSQ